MILIMVNLLGVFKTVHIPFRMGDKALALYD